MLRCAIQRVWKWKTETSAPAQVRNKNQVVRGNKVMQRDFEDVVFVFCLKIGCNMYISCDGEVMMTHACPRGYYWNHDDAACMYGDVSATCDSGQSL